MMTLDKFTAVSQLTDAGELEKAQHFAFYHLKMSGPAGVLRRGRGEMDS